MDISATNAVSILRKILWLRPRLVCEASHLTWPGRKGQDISIKLDAPCTNFKEIEREGDRRGEGKRERQTDRKKDRQEERQKERKKERKGKERKGKKERDKDIRDCWPDPPSEFTANDMLANFQIPNINVSKSDCFVQCNSALDFKSWNWALNFFCALRGTC